MRYAATLLTVALAAAPAASAQRPDPQVELLDRMTGHWVMRGTIARQQTTHDVDVAWVLNREYIQIKETSREKDAQGRPQYDAIVYVVWDPKQGEYAVLWLDNTAAWDFNPAGVGHAKPATDQIPFVFKDPGGGGIRTTFIYDRKADEWRWTIDNEAKGKLTPFARVTLTHK